VQTVLEKRIGELDILERDTGALKKATLPFPRISYDEAVGILHGEGFKDFQWGDDFGAPHETALSNCFEKPVFVHRYPAWSKAFYMELDPKQRELCLSVDLLAPEGYGEIAGGGERLVSLELLERRILERNLPREAYEWYLDLRRYGSMPHSGFGLGVERTVAWVCGLEHVREAIPFPRTLGRMYP